MATQRKTTTKRTKKPSAPSASRSPIRREIGAAVCFLLSFFSFLSITGIDAPVLSGISIFCKWLVGWGLYVVPIAFLSCSIILFFHRGRPVQLRIWCVALSVIVFSALLHMFLCNKTYTWTIQIWTMLGAMANDGAQNLSGGMLGGFLSHLLSTLVSKIGAGFVLILGLFFLIITACNLSISQIYDFFKKERLAYEPQPPREKVQRDPVQNDIQRHNLRRNIDIPLDEATPVKPQDKPVEKRSFFSSKPRVKTPAQVLAEQEGLSTAAPSDDVMHTASVASAPVNSETSSNIPSEKNVVSASSRSKKSDPVEIPEINTSLEKDSSYEFPPIDLLEAGNKPQKSVAGELQKKEDQLVHTIRSFGIEVRIVTAVQGPSVTRYELEMDTGIKLSRLTGLSDDIAMRLGVASVRIAPVPGKGSIVGIEIPNTLVSVVRLRDVIESAEFREHKSHIAFALGKDIAGKCIVGDIARLPHMLIAGTTGSGKSVCTNSLILSLLYRSTPEDVRLIMIDPKMVELGIYNGIPHLLIPVVTDPKKAAGALQWAVTEMMRRYKLFSDCSVRDMYAYNSLVMKNPELGERLPQIVIIIDELADLMMAAAKEVEESVCRIAQMARAAGMHLVIATQRPSADVITGLMKANIPSRIAFAVSSSLESRIILDTQGAEKLVGRGDMLFLPLGVTKPIRIQGTFVTDEERERVVTFLKRNTDSDYSDEIMEQIERQVDAKENISGSSFVSPSDDMDELLPQAVDVILEAGQASTSMLQRRLKLGYSRASRILDQLESRGFVGPFEGSKPRQVLLTKDQWDEMKLSGVTSVHEYNAGNSTPVETGQDSSHPME